MIGKACPLIRRDRNAVNDSTATCFSEDLVKLYTRLVDC